MRVVHADALGHWRGIERIGQMAGLALLRQVHPPGRHLVSAPILSRIIPAEIRRRRDAALAPDIAVVHVVVVRNHRGGHVPKQVAVGPAEHVPLAQVVERRFLERRGLDAEASVALVVLVAQKEDDVRPVVRHVVDDVGVGKAVVGVAAEAGDPHLVAVRRLSGYRALVVIGHGAARQRQDHAQAVRHGRIGAPALDPNVRGTRQRIDRRLGRDLPCRAVTDLEEDAMPGRKLERSQLRGQLQRAPMQRVLGKADRAERRPALAHNPAASDFPVGKTRCDGFDSRVSDIHVTQQRDVADERRWRGIGLECRELAAGREIERGQTQAVPIARRLGNDPKTQRRGGEHRVASPVADAELPARRQPDIQSGAIDCRRSVVVAWSFRADPETDAVGR